MPKPLNVLIILLSATAIIASGIYAYNPQQQAKQKTDKEKQDTASSFVNAVKKYKSLESTTVWETLSISPFQTLALQKLPPETMVELLDQKATSVNFQNSQFNMHILITVNDQNQVSACFRPESKKFIFHAQDNSNRADGTRFCDPAAADGENACYTCVIEE